MADLPRVKKASLFEQVSSKSGEEVFEKLLETRAFRLERIVSRGQSSPEGFWYDQEQNEWVMVARGRAGLRFEGKNEVMVLEPGDWVYIPAHCKHRVEWTDPSEATVWLAIHHD